MKIKIFGERNCGTRALGLLLRRNLGAELLPSTAADLDPDAFARIDGDMEAGIDAIYRGADAARAWKHCATNFTDIESLSDCLTVILVKHPLSWLASLFDRPYHQLGPRADTIAELAATPWRTVERERLGGRAFLPLDLYAEKLASYQALAPRVGAVFVRFEDLIADPQAVLGRLGHDGPFAPLEESTKEPGRTLADYRDYYGRERWRERVGDLSVAPDWAQVEAFGYC